MGGWNVNDCKDDCYDMKMSGYKQNLSFRIWLD